MIPERSYLVWVESLREDSRRLIAEAGVEGSTRRSGLQLMPQMID